MNYFKILKEDGKVECLECGKKISSSNKNNRIRHYKLVHNKNIVIPKSRHSILSQVPVNPSKRLKNIRTKPCYFVKINLDRNEFLKCCVGLVTVTNMPFHIFDDNNFFKTLISPYEETFNTNLNSKTIVNVLSSTVNEIKQTIKDKIKDRMISLKIDVAKEMDCRILGVNIEYIINSTICINTLGVIQLEANLSEPYLRNQVLNCLKLYDIEFKQIYCTTVSNVGKRENDATEENINEMVQSIQESLTPVLTVARCATYNIQLAAYDVVITMQTEIIHCKKQIDILRNKNEYKQLPYLRNTTCWNSVFETLKSLLTIKDVIEEYYKGQFINQNINWSFVVGFVVSFTPLVTFTNLLKNKQYVFGDFYRDWLNCEIELEEISCDAASKLHEAMQNRRQLLLENDTYIAALYLDPRFNFLNSIILSEQQKTQAIEHLIKTFENMRELDDPNYVKDDSNVTENVSKFIKTEQEEFLEETDTPSTSKAYAKLAQRIMSSAIKNSEMKNTFREKLMYLSTKTMISLATDILEYFKTTSMDPDIWEVMKVVFAVPANLVTAKRTCSALSATLKNLKDNNLSNDDLNNFLITKFNFSEVKLEL